MADVRTTVLRRVEAGGFIDSSFVIDAAGNQFLVIGVAEYPPTNNTWAEVYKIPPGGPVPAQPQWRVLPSGVQKIDAVTVYYSGTDLMVELVTHEPGPAPRDTTVELGVIPGVFVYEPGMERHSGGPGAFQGGGAEPPPGGGGDVDYAQIERIVDFVVSRIVGAQQTNSLVQQFGGNVRQGLEDKAKDSLVEATNPANYDSDPRARAYQDALYPFLKNAAAAPLANVLGAQDEWGQDRQEELRVIIKECVREVLDETEGEVEPLEPAEDVQP